MTVTGGTVGRLELEDGEEGTFIDDVHGGGYTVNVSEGDRGERRHFWRFSFEVPKEGVRTPASVPAQVSRTASREGAATIVPEHVVPCERPTTIATVRELVVDSDGRFVRFRATFTLACPSGPRAEGDLRFHALT